MVKNRVCYLLLLLCTAAFLVCYNGYLSLYIFVLSLVFPAGAFLASLPSMLGTRLSLSAGKERAGTHSGGRYANAPCARKGEAIPLRLDIWNTTPFTSGRVRARLTVENTLTGQREQERFTFTASPKHQVLEHQLSSPTCGQVVCRLDRLWVSDYLGLFSLPVRKVHSREATAFFWPAVSGLDLEVQEGSVPGNEGERYSQKRPGDDPTELFALRDYREGDRLTRIHWKLSQKLGKPLVKELGLPIADHLFFLLDLNGDGAAVDTLLDGFASLSSFLAERETAHRVGYWDQRVQALQTLEIAQPEDLLPVWRELLASGGRAPLPPLEESSLPSGISHGLYLCCRPQEHILGTLRAAYPAARLSVLQSTSALGAAREIQPAANLAGARVTVLRPGQTARNLNGFLL